MIMNKEMSINAREERMNLVMNAIAMAAARPLTALKDYYGSVLNKNMSTKQTLCLLNAQFAFIVNVFAGCSLMMRAFLLAWLVGALLKCKDALSI